MHASFFGTGRAAAARMTWRPSAEGSSREAGEGYPQRNLREWFGRCEPCCRRLATRREFVDMIPCQGSSTRPAPIGPKRGRGGTPHRSPRRPPSGLPAPPPFPRWACGPRPGVRGECRRKRNWYEQAGRPCDRPFLARNPAGLSLQTTQGYLLKAQPILSTQPIQ